MQCNRYALLLISLLAGQSPVSAFAAPYIKIIFHDDEVKKYVYSGKRIEFPDDLKGVQCNFEKFDEEELIITYQLSCITDGKQIAAMLPCAKRPSSSKFPAAFQILDKKTKKRLKLIAGCDENNEP